MSQKAICPRGHIWDPSTLAGLPPTETPRCPICGEEESSRLGNSLARLKRFCRNNPLLASLAGVCLLLSVTLVGMIFQARSKIQTVREELDTALIEAQQTEAKLRSRLRTAEPEDKEQQHQRQAKIDRARWDNREKEFAAQLREVEKTARDARKQRDEQFQQRRLAEELAQTAEQVRKDSLSQRAETARQLVKMNVAAGTRLMENGDLSASLLWFTEALRLAEKERLPVQTHRLRLAYVLAQCPRPVQMRIYDKTPNVVQLSPDGKRVLAAPADREVEIWDTASGKRIGGLLKHEGAVTNAAFSPDGKRVLTVAADDTLNLWDIEKSDEVFTPLECPSPVAGLAFSADGKRFLIVTNKKPAMGANDVEMPVGLHVCDAENAKAVGEIALGSEISPRPAMFSPDGQRVLTVCQDRCARIWDIATNKQVGPSFSHAAELVQAMFSADGERVLTASVDGTARVWKAKTGEPLTPLFKHGSAVRGASLSTEGRYALTFGEDREVRVWDVSKGEVAGPALRHAEAVSDAIFSPDGRYVLTLCADGAARLWDYASGQEILPALRHGEPIRYAAFTAAGDGVLTLAGQVVRLWDLTVGEPATPPVAPREAGLEVLSPDGKYVLRATETVVRVYDTRTNQVVGGTLPHKNKVTAAAFSPDGKLVLTVCHQPNGDQLEGHVRIWETATGELLGQPLVHPRSVLEAGFNRDGRRVATACQDGKARLWDVEKNSLVGEPLEHKQDLSRTLFLPSGKYLLTVDVEGGLRLWDADTAEAVGPTWGHRKPIHNLAFSRDGQQLVTASADGTASVWESSTGREIATTPVQGAPVLRAVFSPDGKRIATVSGEGRVRVWDSGNGKPVSPPLRHRSAVALAVFSDDGRRIVTAAADGLRVWEATSGEPISPLMRGVDRSRNVSDGKTGETPVPPSIANASGSFRADDRPVTELVRVAEVLSSERMTDAGEAVPVDGAELNKLWKDMRSRYGKDLAASPQRLAAWHDRGASECERRHLWIGALRHLDCLIQAGVPADLYARRGRANLELRRWQAAKADYTQALTGDTGRWDLLAGRAEAEAALGRWQAAAADYSKAIERKGNRAELWAARGRVEAEQSDWRKAAADLGKAVSLGQQDATVWTQHILALLASGEAAKSRPWCERLVKRFADSKDEAIFQKVVWTCALAGESVRDWQPLLRHAERDVKANPQSANALRQLAVLLYRAGQYDAAKKRLQEALEEPRSQPTARDDLLMALIEQRLEHADEAKKWLEKAEQIRSDRAKDDKESWEERLMYETLHREAETLMKGAT